MITLQAFSSCEGHHSQYQRRDLFRMRPPLLTIWEEDRSHFQELSRKRLATDYAFRELLFGYYTRKYIAQRDRACTALAICHYKTYLRQIHAKQQQSINVSPSSSISASSASFVSSSTPPSDSLHGRHVGTEKTRERGDLDLVSSPIISSTSGDTDRTESPFAAASDDAELVDMDLHDDIEPFEKVLRSRRYWIYLRFMLRHSNLPGSLVALGVNEQDLYKQLMMLEHSWFRLVCCAAGDDCGGKGSTGDDSAGDEIRTKAILCDHGKINPPIDCEDMGIGIGGGMDGP